MLALQGVGLESRMTKKVMAPGTVIAAVARASLNETQNPTSAKTTRVHSGKIPFDTAHVSPAPWGVSKAITESKDRPIASKNVF